jgi:hypothetical protein
MKAVMAFEKHLRILAPCYYYCMTNNALVFTLTR